LTDLVVDLYGHRVGMLREARGSFDFEADPDAVTRHGVGSSILSFAVPLVANPRPGDAPLRRNFFDEILPEGRARTRLAGNARLAPDYTIGMLARYGRDVAGAVKIWDPEAPGEPREPALNPISNEEVRTLLEDVAQAPIGNTTVRRMSSLAGVQDKIVLTRTDDGWAEPLDGYPSTHIIKPVVPSHPSLIFDEEYGARIARALGLAELETRVESFAGASALVIERYDRDEAAPDHRLHQEDFNQVLGMSGDGKYQEHGHPGLTAIARVLLAQVGRGAIDDLLRLTTMSVTVGNLDMHAKNISVLHLPDGRVRLAPAYDIVPQTHLEFDQTFAFEVNGTDDMTRMTADDLIREGETWGVRDATSIVEITIGAVERFVAEERPHAGAHAALADDIARISRNLLDGRAAVDGARQPRGPRPLRQAPGGWGGPVAR
jgi:serine/threonine-protein kinase HipA